MNRYTLFFLSTLFLFSCAPEDTPLPGGSARDFLGLNWSDPRDNFVDEMIVPSGLEAGLSRAQMRVQSINILSQFKSLTDANTIRVAINAPTVLDGDYWERWKGILDAAQDQNMKVIIGCWERPAENDGRADERFDEMWDKVILELKDSSSIYFEPLNEPFGYTTAGWKNFAAKWLDNYPDLPRGRVLIGGAGFSEYVDKVAKDERFDGCLFSQHLYAWWGKFKTEERWGSNLRSRIGEAYADRTVVTEFGTEMKTGIDFNGEICGDEKIAYLRGMSAQISKWNLGSVYWPGLRDGDAFSLLERDPGNVIGVSNPSGMQVVLQSFE